MARTLLFDVRDDEERRAALLEDGRLSLLWVEREDERSLVGNIYKGRVLRVEPAINAAFVDLGLDRPGFLPADDVQAALNGEAAPTDSMTGEPPEPPAAAVAAEAATAVAAPPVRPAPPPPSISERFSPGDAVVVQVSRDSIGRKGPTLTTHVSYPGRTLVVLPSLGRLAVSRKIEDPDTRRRVQEALERLGAPAGVGVVARTAIVDADATEVTDEFARLFAAHEAVNTAAETQVAPSLLHEAADFVTRAVRELAVRAPEGSTGPLRIVADSEDAAARARKALGANAEGVEVVLHASEMPLFHAFGIERAVRELDDPRVLLPGGASIHIDETEAMWTIDVNSGRLRTGTSLEETALETDLLAAREAARQIRLRDLSGLVVVDFIDCKEPENRKKVEDTFKAELARDPARMRAAAMSEFMTVEITRRRLRSGAARSGSVPCPSCRGRGRVHSATAAGLRLIRDLRAAAVTGAPRGLSVRCSHEIATALGARKAELDALRARGLAFEVAPVPGSPPDWFEVRKR